MNFKYHFFAINIFFFTITHSQPHHVITFFIKDLSLPKFKAEKNRFFGINKKIIKNNTQSTIPKNVFALYHGYIAISNEYGQITFPRQTEKTDFKILITNKIEPVFMFPNTIDHWEVSDNIPFKMYSVSRKKYKDYTYWQVENAIPENKNRIAIDTIIILAKPKNAFVITGNYLTNDIPQIVLPDIFMKKDFNSNEHALFAMEIKKFFGRIKSEHQIKENGHLKLIK